MYYGQLKRQAVVAATLLLASMGVRADCFEHHGARFGLDPALLRAIAHVESRGRPHAVNLSHRARTGSMDVGLMQINTGWLPRLARHGISRSDLSDPCTSIEIGAWILSDLMRRQGVTWDAVGAYNAACSELKGAACSRARSAYAWQVFGHLQAQARRHPSAAAPARATGAAGAAATGLVSLASVSDAAHLQGHRQ